MFGIWGLAWLIATGILIFFVNTYGWKPLASWQQWYVL